MSEQIMRNSHTQSHTGAWACARCNLHTKYMREVLHTKYMCAVLHTKYMRVVLHTQYVRAVPKCGGHDVKPARSDLMWK